MGVTSEGRGCVGPIGCKKGSPAKANVDEQQVLLVAYEDWKDLWKPLKRVLPHLAHYYYYIQGVCTLPQSFAVTATSPPLWTLISLVKSLSCHLAVKPTQ